ncbi:hypothetical protein BD769DRAFT_1393414 [Suillus cothurnatus]|nr:hypothetical protein BD769DRAFT_1393414 [Suillus cothurnatus]
MAILCTRSKNLFGLLMWFGKATFAGKWASDATWEQGRSEQPKTQKHIMDPMISAPHDQPPQESQIRLLEALVREVHGIIYGKDIFIQPSLGLAECMQRFISIDEFIGIDQFNEPQITIDIIDQGTSPQELLDKHSASAMIQMQSTSSGIEKQSTSGLDEPSPDNKSQQSCKSKGKRKAADVPSPPLDPLSNSSTTFSTLPKFPNLPPSPPASPIPTVQINPASELIAQNQQFPPEAMASMMTWFSTGFSHLALMLEVHQSAIVKRIEDNIKEIRQICTWTQEQQRNLSSEYHAKSKAKRKKCAGFVPDPKDDCGDAPTDHSKVAYNAFKACIHQHAHHLLKVSDYKLLTSSNCSITEDENFAYISDAPGHIQITADNFCLDLMCHQTMKFNVDAILIFSLDFIEKATKFRCCERCILFAFQTIQDYYKDIEKVKNGMSIEELKDKKELELKKKQLKVCALNGGPFTPHMALLQEAGSAGCSSDESESEPDQEPAYLQKTSRFLGVNFMSSRANRRWCRNVPHTRLHSNKTNLSVSAPPSLPRNCYNPVWYNLLPLEAKLRLNIKDWDWDFCNGGQLEVVPQTGDYCVPDPLDPFDKQRMQVDKNCGEGPSNSSS